ncbi:MAG: flagellar biosynthetic protein FliQ [Planctomyces sp.]|jgi:flagellar biosynthetic protein FliQ
METSEVVEIGRDLLMTAMYLSAPAVLVSLFVGLAISLLQTLTSVQEQTLSFAPRIVAVGGIMLVTLPWMLQVSTSFTVRMMERLIEVAR